MFMHEEVRGGGGSGDDGVCVGGVGWGVILKSSRSSEECLLSREEHRERLYCFPAQGPCVAVSPPVGA